MIRSDSATAREGGTVLADIRGTERGHWKAHALVEKWDPDIVTWAEEMAPKRLRHANADDLAKLAHLHARQTMRKHVDPIDLANARMLWTGRLTGAQIQALAGDPGETVDWSGNLLVNVGIQRLEDLLMGVGSIVGYSNTTARLGTGNGAGTAAAGDTDLSASAGSSNRWFQIMDATFPSRSSQTITFKSSFASADGNYAWNEFGVDGNGAAGSTAVVGTNDATHAALLNHKTSAALGTKATGSVFAFTMTILVS